MKIRLKNSSEVHEVYGVYWIDGCRYYLYIPYEEYTGVSTLKEEECDLIDPELIQPFVLRKNDYGGDFLLHQAAHEGDLIKDLIEHDPDAMAEFKRRLLNLQITKTADTDKPQT